MASPIRKLEQLVRDGQLKPSERQLRNQIIADSVFATSPYLREPNFQTFHPDDIRLLCELYDENYFQGLLLRSLKPAPINFRLSKRMTKAGGKTTRWGNPLAKKPLRYEIAISATLLFQSFQDPERHITVTGLECESRLEGLMRVMEHELVHLVELMVWTDSNCTLHRFQDIASRVFGHLDHRHDLITTQEVAVTQYGIRPGDRVRFDFDGHTMEGIVNRITKRATVLVSDPEGQQYSDGERYLKFYIPLRHLEAAD